MTHHCTYVPKRTEPTAVMASDASLTRAVSSDQPTPAPSPCNSGSVSKSATAARSQSRANAAGDGAAAFNAMTHVSSWSSWDLSSVALLLLMWWSASPHSRSLQSTSNSKYHCCKNAYRNVSCASGLERCSGSTNVSTSSHRPLEAEGEGRGANRAGDESRGKQSSPTACFD